MLLLLSQKSYRYVRNAVRDCSSSPRLIACLLVQSSESRFGVFIVPAVEDGDVRVP
jgi:hypothetical protein